jgi:hypothetical protein
MNPIPLANLVGSIPDNLLALFIAMAAIIFSVTRWRKNTIRKNKAKDAAPMNTSPSTTPNALSVREVTTQIHAMLADIEETSRRATAQIQNRCVKLETLLTEADAKIARLESLLQDQSSSPRPQQPSTNPSQDRTVSTAAQDPAYSAVYQLADQGKSSREIAQELNRQPGEIELILALRAR